MAKEEIHIVDKRSAKRLKGKFTFKYGVVGKDGADRVIAVTMDVSTRGVAFESSEVIAIGTQIIAEFDVPSIPKPIKIEGSIIRIEEIEKNTNYLYCMKVEKMDREAEASLEQHIQTIDIDNLLRGAVAKGASDVHLVPDQLPIFRIEGELFPFGNVILSREILEQMIVSIMTEKQRAAFRENLELDFSYSISGGTRFRVNIHLEKGNLEAALRVIPSNIRTIHELGLPPVLEELAWKRSGLIVVSGLVGSGKTTTLAAMIELINRDRKCVIISIEDPIEYVYKSKKSIVKQRELGADTLSFNQALKHILRQDPNVILIGEMRDLDSIAMAITAAETGHLVLTTLHTQSVTECINRIVDVYPGSQQNQIRTQLAGCLEAIITQVLLPRRDGNGRAVAAEVLIATQAIRTSIRMGKMEQLHMYLETGRKVGMQTMDQSLLELVDNGIVDQEIAKGFARERGLFE